MTAKRILIGITGASGAPLAVELLRQMADMPVETHVILSESGEITLSHECKLELPRPVQAEDHERHATGLVFETSVDNVNVNDGPEDTGHKSQYVVDGFLRDHQARYGYFF